MKSTILGVLGLLFFSASILAQISPNPVIETEIRDNNSIRMRSMELERVKRDINKTTTPGPNKEQAVKFALIKEDFENIQKLENEIVKTYTSGKQINYTKISELAAELSKKAGRLDENLFITKSDLQVKTERNKADEPKSIRNLIIELDKSISNFIVSPMFTNGRLVDSKISEKTELELNNIIMVGKTIADEAKKFKQ